MVCLIIFFKSDIYHKANFIVEYMDLTEPKYGSIRGSWSR